MITSLLVLFAFLPQSTWLNSKSLTDYRNVWVDGSNSVKNNYLLHLYLARMRADSRILKAGSYFASPLSVRMSKGLTFSFVSEMKTQIDGQKLYRPEDFDYGDSRSSLEMVKIPEVHKKGFVGIGVKIALLDVGVDSTHPAVSHIWRRHGVIAKHDFNSGDHLYLRGLNSEIPLIRHGLIQYINSFDVASDSSHLVVIYSISPTDSIGSSYLYGKWTLGLTVGNLSYGQVTSWDTIHIDGYATEKNFPSIALRNDTAFVAYQEYQGNFRVKFVTYDLVSGNLSTPVLLSTGNHESVNPIVLANQSSVYIAWVDTTAGLMLRVSTDGGRSFFPPDTLISFEGLPAGLDGLMRNDTLIVSCGVGDSSMIYFATSSDTEIATVNGILPAVELIDGNVVIGVFDSSKVKFYRFSTGLSNPVEIFSKDADFIYNISISGDTAYVADGSLWSTSLSNPAVTLIDSEFVDFVSSGIYTVYRKRGDTDITPDPYDPTEHGTKMLSIIGGFLEGSIVGGAPGADYLIAKTERVVSGPNGNDFESVIEEDFWVEAMEWSIRHGAQLLSSSLGYRYTNGRDNYGDSLMTGNFAHSSKMASEAYKHNLVVITAMGNVSHFSFPDPTIGDTSLVVPADARNVISVGGIVSPDSVEPNCGFGPTADGRIKPDIVAPYRISWPDTDGTVYIIGGTSISTAIVAGGIGAVLEAHPSWNAQKILQYVHETTSRFPGLPDPNNLTGYGIFNALSLLQHEPLDVPAPGDRDRIIAIYPNPLKGTNTVKIKYRSFHTGLIRAYVYTIGGELVTQKSLGCTGIGENKFVLNLPEKISPGTYIILLRSGFTTTKGLLSVVK